LVRHDGVGTQTKTIKDHRDDSEIQKQKFKSDEFIEKFKNKNSKAM